jgi:hypothetical protein
MEDASLKGQHFPFTGPHFYRLFISELVLHASSRQSFGAGSWSARRSRLLAAPRLWGAVPIARETHVVGE